MAERHRPENKTQNYSLMGKTLDNRSDNAQAFELIHVVNRDFCNPPDSQDLPCGECNNISSYLKGRRILFPSFTS
jgi:hypothetical protein